MNAPLNSGAGVEVREAALAAERALLGELMLDTAAAWAGVEPVGLTAQDMGSDAHALIYGAILRIVARGEQADLVTVVDTLSETGPQQLERAGGLNYINELASEPFTVRNAGQHAAAVRRAAKRRKLETLGAVLARNADTPGILDELLFELQAGDGPQRALELFRDVDVAALADHLPPAPEFWWHQYMPAGLVTMLGAHGGTGKSTFALMLCVCIALGRPLFGVGTRAGIAVFYSGEDDVNLLSHRLAWICRCMGVSPLELEGRLHILDATEGDPVLFRETQEFGRRVAGTTAAFDALRCRLDKLGADVLVVDGMSDTFDGSEIQRSSVSAFLRALGMLAKPRRAVLLTAHVDKGTARGDRPGGSQGYSGSTASHNKARSRLFMYRDKDDTLVIEHQKNNLGRMREPLRLVWNDGELPTVVTPPGPQLQFIADLVDTKALLRLVHEFYVRGEFISTSKNSPTSLRAMLASQPGYPAGRSSGQVLDLLRTAQRQGYIEPEAYSRDRKERERWALTRTGLDLIGATAPTAPTAPTPNISEVGAPGEGSAPTAPTPGARGVGRLGAHQADQKSAHGGAA